MNKNAYAQFFGIIARRFFNDIVRNEDSLMKACYVYAHGLGEIESGLRRHFADQLTPYFKADGAVEIEQHRTGGQFTRRIANSIKGEKSDVVILYGGKGAGKSTFLTRLFFYEPPQEFQLHAFPVIVDFLQAPQSTGDVSEFVWREIVRLLDLDNLLEGTIDDLARLFADRLAVAERQDLAAYPPQSDAYRIEKNKLVLAWRHESHYVAKCLQAHWKNRQKGLVIAFDNTDQLTPALQDHCFLVAQNVARQMGCVTVISMREERYCRARTSGVLDAYHDTGFHLGAPDLSLVFTKRLSYLISELWKENKSGIEGGLLPLHAPFDSIVKFFKQCLRQFSRPSNALCLFLRECSRDNTRLALTFFKQFLTSGYTHVQEMVDNPGWTVSRHQVIKPMMIPERYNYDESKSLIPNIFQCRTPSAGSHMTGLRLLHMLRKGQAQATDHSGFYRVSALFDYFDSTFGMGKDFEMWADIFLRHGMVEASNRLDAFSVPATIDGQEVEIRADEIKVTSFGVYMFDHLCRAFAYIELSSLDCGLGDESLCNDFRISASDELRLGKGERFQRLQLRIERAKRFISYLKQEEEREVVEFMLADSDRLMNNIELSFLEDLKRVDKSAKRTVRRDANLDDGMAELLAYLGLDKDP